MNFDITGSLTTIVSFVLVLGVLVLVHEFGHFWVAKKSGVRVLKFSIGMGPKMLGVRRGDTEYLISWVPFGGYVKMAGEDPEEEKSGAPDEFSSKSTPIRAAIIVAGPLMNYLLAIVIYSAIFLIQGADTIQTRVVGAVEEEGLAATAGFAVGDEVVSVNDETIKDWYAFLKYLVKTEEETVAVRVQRGGATEELTLALGGPDRDLSDLGLSPYVPAVIGKVQKGGPAWEAGIRAGDRIVSVAGEPIELWSELAGFVHDSPGQALSIAWDHAGERMEATVTPDEEKVPISDTETRTVGLIRIEQRIDRERLAPWRAVSLGVQRTLFVTQEVLRFFGQFFRFQVKLDMIGGPIRIGQIAGESARWGFYALVNLVALLSVNLAILNLLPIPILDGGHLFLMGIETVRGRPLSLKQRMVLQQIGLAVIILLMVTVTGSDIRRLFQ